MKKLMFLWIAILLIVFSFSGSNAGASTTESDSLIVLSTPDLSSVVMKWAAHYNKAFPGEKIMVKTIDGRELSGDMLKTGSIAIIQDSKNYPGFDNESVWMITVARDVFVPVINSGNPLIGEIEERGISPVMLASVMKNDLSPCWDSMFSTSALGRNVNFFYLDDPRITGAIAELLGIPGSRLKGSVAENPGALLTAVRDDPFSIGFCRLADLGNNGSMPEGISLMPVDRNSNGIMESNENIYTDLNSFSRGVWIGKYPKSLINNISSAFRGSSGNEKAIAFVRWMLGEGQEHVNSSGYTPLLLTERSSGIDKLTSAPDATVANTGAKPVFSTILIFFVALLLAFFLIDYAIKAFRKKPAETVIRSFSPGILDPAAIRLPNGIYFDKTHTWAFMEQNGSVRVGVDDFLQHFTGTINRLKLKKEGDKIRKGDEILSVIQNGKQLNLYSPVTGTIKERNISLESNASVINSSPYNEGWVYRIEPDNWQRENQLLFMADKHRKFINEEVRKIKDFLAGLVDTEHSKYSTVILQDGGMLQDGALSLMPPEVWEEYQTRFIDPSRQVWFYEII